MHNRKSSTYRKSRAFQINFYKMGPRMKVTTKSAFRLFHHPFKSSLIGHLIGHRTLTSWNLHHIKYGENVREITEL